MHDIAPVSDDGHRVAIFNPGSNLDQASYLRLVNPGTEDAEVTVTGVDDTGASPGTAVEIGVPAGESVTVTSSELESGAGLRGALGDGTGQVAPEREFGRAHPGHESARESGGLLTNLSTGPLVPAEHGGHVVPLFPSAADPQGRQGVVRVVNRSAEAGSVRIEARDDSEVVYETVTLSMDAGVTAHLKLGRPGARERCQGCERQYGRRRRGLATGAVERPRHRRVVVHSNYGRLRFSDVGARCDAFARREHWVAIFNPGSNADQVSRLRLVSPGMEDAVVTVTGVDDAGASPGSPVVLTVPAGASRTLTAAQLESGGEGLTGALGEGAGKWRLRVQSDQPVLAMSLLSNPTGHLTNLSTSPYGSTTGAEAVRQVAENTVPGEAVGEPVTGAFGPGARLTHVLEGSDEASFDIDESTGQLRTREGIDYDHEARSAYHPIVQVVDGLGGMKHIPVMVKVMDEEEPPAGRRRRR